MSHTPSLTTRSLVYLALSAVATALGAVGCSKPEQPQPAPDFSQATYVGGKSCVACHQKQHDEWVGSHHDLAMEIATSKSVLGDFNDAEFTYQGVTSRMFTRDGRYFIHTEGPDGEMADFEIAYTFGVTPLQQYMVKFPDGRVQVLRVSWNTEKKEWFYVNPPDVIDEKLEPGDPLHWTGVGQNWNHTCADCHSTDYHKNFDLAANRYDSKFVEIDVSCEACHGPGSVHVKLAEANKLSGDHVPGYGLPILRTTPVTRPFVGRPLSQTRNQIEACAKCHSRRRQIHPDFRPGGPLLDHYEPSLLDETLYHADGQIQDEVYVYGSFLQSQMYHQGVACSDCHNPHSLKLRFPGAALCTQCHIAGKYDTPAHHHHLPNTPGASCVECHMPETTYMVVDPRRDHSIRNPRPDLSVLLGTPNACNNCHNKPPEDAKWAAEKVRQWYGPQRPDDPHYALALAAGRAGAPDGEQKLLELLKKHPAADRQTPDIVRATALSLLAQYPGDETSAAMEQALSDRDPLLRTTAARYWGAQDSGRYLRKMVPLLQDPSRAVRFAVAERLLPVSAPPLSERHLATRGKVIEELKQDLLHDADRAATHNHLGGLYESQRQYGAAADSYRQAIRVEPYLSGARAQLAALLEREQLARKNLSPEQTAKEVRRLREEDLEILENNARLLPNSPIAHFQLGLMLHLLGRTEEAETPLAKACQLDPGSYNYRLTLTLLYERLRQWDQAIQSLQELNKLRPNDPAVNGIYQRIQATRPR